MLIGEGFHLLNSNSDSSAVRTVNSRYIEFSIVQMWSFREISLWLSNVRKKHIARSRNFKSANLRYFVLFPLLTYVLASLTQYMREGTAYYFQISVIFCQIIRHRTSRDFTNILFLTALRILNLGNIAVPSWN